MQGRAGSSVFCDLLDSHSGVRCHSELLISRYKNPFRFLSSLANYYHTYPVWGFKVKMSQIRQNASEDSFRNYLVHNNFRVFCLFRENALKAALSSLIGWKRGNVYHNTAKADGGRRQPVHLEPERVIKAIRRVEADREEILRFAEGLNPITFTYEKHLANAEQQQATCNRVFEAMDLPAFRVKTEFKKVSTKNPSDSIANFPELLSAVKQTGYMHYLDDLQAEG